MTCYRNGGCGPFEMYSCNVCPASKPEYLQREQPKPKARANRIRAMTDEELAWAYAYRLASCYGCEASTIEDCVKCTLDWLRQEAEADAKLD